MIHSGFEYSEHTLFLRKQIDDLTKDIINSPIPRIPLSGYLKFIADGSREESEEAYFERRKQLAALCLYLQYHKKSEPDYDRVLRYFEELLWDITNEMSWCVAAHLPMNESGFVKEPAYQIDLFAAETGAALSEAAVIHGDILSPFLLKHIQEQMDKRIFEPFLWNQWWWERVQSNWSAVCCGSIGMAALLLEKGDRKKQILHKADQGLNYYLKGFKADGACEEGIGYWVYGFGYYIYYVAMRKERDKAFSLSKDVTDKIKKIAEFPALVQMDLHTFVSFSDVPQRTMIPSGLLSYLHREYDVDIPAITETTSFDLDSCYRFAHISRNLWWTDQRIFSRILRSNAVYLTDRQWLLQRNNGCFVGVKGGNNEEYHNHNDAGSFIITMDEETFLTDLGAGRYSADYFGEKRYEFVHTRSRYHNLPLINGKEQIPTDEKCRVENVTADIDFSEITMETAMMYGLSELRSLRRTIISHMDRQYVMLEDIVEAKEAIEIEEGFISYFCPVISENGEIVFNGERGYLILSYESSFFTYSIEEILLKNHYGEDLTAYRLGLLQKEKKKNSRLEFRFTYIKKNNLT